MNEKIWRIGWFTALTAAFVIGWPGSHSRQTPWIPSAAGAPSPGSEPGVDEATEADLLRSSLLHLFSGYEYLPTKEDLLRLAKPELLLPALAAIFWDESQPLNKRIHALEATRHFPSPASRDFLEQVLLDPGSHRGARRVAVKTYGRAFGPEATSLLALLADHDDPHTREAVVRTLGRIGTDEALYLIQARSGIEPEEWIRTTIKRTLEPTK